MLMIEVPAEMSAVAILLDTALVFQISKNLKIPLTEKGNNARITESLTNSDFRLQKKVVMYQPSTRSFESK